MLKSVSRMQLIGGWVAVLIAFCVAIGASFSTSVLLLLFGMAPAVVMVLIARGAPSPSVAEILHSVEAKDGRL
jgi:hypothetical protein